MASSAPCGSGAASTMISSSSATGRLCGIVSARHECSNTLVPQGGRLAGCAMRQHDPAARCCPAGHAPRPHNRMMGSPLGHANWCAAQTCPGAHLSLRDAKPNVASVHWFFSMAATPTSGYTCGQPNGMQVKHTADMLELHPAGCDAGQPTRAGRPCTSQPSAKTKQSDPSPAHRPDLLAGLQLRKVLQEPPRQLPEAQLVALLGVHGPRQRVPQLRQQHLHLVGRQARGLRREHARAGAGARQLELRSSGSRVTTRHT